MRSRRPKKKEKKRRGIYILPNLITTASLFCGFYAIGKAIEGSFLLACWAIIISLILDGLDGRIARFTRSSSNFGVEYDSLVDLVAFGVAPGVLVYLFALQPYGKFGWMAAFLYVVCGALRLARFNVQVPELGTKHFVGLPIPAAASFMAISILLFFHLEGYDSLRRIPFLVAMYCLSFLMVSNIPYTSFKELEFFHKKSFNVLVGAVLLFVLVASEPYIMLFALILCYVVSGPVIFLARIRKKTEVTETQVSQEAP
jgi:CDP-diacylglycerol--serine O-phosphatidyltransferase